MRFGIWLPNCRHLATPEIIRRAAVRAEALGYDSVWVSDHVVVPRANVGNFGETIFDPLITLGVVAGATSRVRLGTTVLIVPYRQAVVTAKMVSSLDALSGGRVVLGVGVGWMREEIELLGGNYDRRGAWSDEAIAVMRACWRDARTAHRGEFFSFDDVGVFPKPVRGDIPILVGGHTPRALRRVVERGDGWHAAFISPPALGEDIARLREECARQKRPFDQLTISVRAGLSLRSAPLGSDRKPLQGSRDQIIADLTAYRDLGVGTILLETRYRDLQEILATYDTFARDILPNLQ